MKLLLVAIVVVVVSAQRDPRERGRINLYAQCVKT
jgi:hypothetical protein